MSAEPLISQDARRRLSTAGSAEAVETLSLLFSAQRQQRDQLLGAPLAILARTRAELAQLSRAGTPAGVFAAAPAALCRACGFDRAASSTVNGSIWKPVALHVETSPRSPVNVSLAQSVTDCEVSLTSTMPEAELVRRRSPVLVPRAQTDPSLNRSLVELSNTAEYVAAPIQACGKVLGFLHADCHDSRRPLTVLDRDRVQRFADGVGWIIERKVALERLTLQENHVRRALSAVEAVVEKAPVAPFTRGAEAALRETVHTNAAINQAPTPLEGLTAREWQVMQLILGGATNAEIADQLTVSETTVKSHVKHILRKLHATNRSQAIARYLYLTKRQVRL